MRHKGRSGTRDRAPTLGIALLFLTAGLGRVDAQTAAPFVGSFDQRFINQGRVAPVFTRPEVHSRLPPLPLPAESAPPSAQTTEKGASGGSEAAEPQGSVTALKKLLIPPAEASPSPALPLNSPPPPAPESTTHVAGPAQHGPPEVTGSLQACLPTGQTASGERVNPNRVTAVHRTLPSGVNLRKRRPATVRINDRGPPKLKLASGLSRACARAIEVTGGGWVVRYRTHGVLGASTHQHTRPKRPPAPTTVMRRDHVVETTGSIPARPRLRPPSRLVSTPAARFVLPEALRPRDL